jgi:hypothetical protein
MKKAFRLFISSTFADFKAERDLLHNEVFPKIREYCEEKGFTFQPIDLRWGVNSEAQFDQKTIPVCLSEVKICASYPHPNFLIMLGDRYGWVPLPYMIERSEFDQILKNTKAQADVNLIKKWYYLDENQIPSSYVLRPRLGKFKNYEMWSAEEERLRSILQKAAVNLPEDKKKKYFMSATHYEFNEIYKDEGNKDYIVSVFRHIKNSKQNREQDIENFRQSVEDNTLKHNVIDEYIDEKFEILNRSEFVEKIENKLKENIDRGIKEVASLPKGSEHNQFKTKELDLFLGREKSLKRIADYLDDDTDTPLIVHSSSGMGKTTLMKKAIENLENDLSDVDIFYRFVGADGKSFYKRDLLIGIIDEMPGENKLDKQDEYKFDEQIKEILSKDSVKKIAIFIDALDQLRVRDALLWLPQKLGKNVKIVLSVLNDENFAEDSGYYRNLLGKYGDRNTLNLNDDSLQCNTKELFDKFLGKYSRKLTDEQMLAVADKFNDANSSPLYAFIIAQELRYLKSGGEIDIANDVPSAVNEFIDNLKNLYYQEERLMQKVLSYIAFSKYGISENELLDLLSQDIKKDKKLQKRVFFIQETDNIVFPTSLWASLYSLLEPFLTLVQKDDKLLINFVHRQFVWTVSKRYEKYKEETHAILAKYFCSFDRKDKIWNERYYSPRALSEIFYHLYHSNSKNLETYLNDLELIGSIYDSEKYEDFREILDILDEDKFFVQKGFYREKDYLIKGVDKKCFTAHTVLFQLAYADGDNSQLTKSAKKLLKDGRVNFPWLQIQKIPKEFKRIGLLGVFDWDYVKKLSNGNLLVRKTGGNHCLFTSDFKMIADLGTNDGRYTPLNNGNLLCEVFEHDGYPDSSIKEIRTVTNNGQNINILESAYFQKELENGDLILRYEDKYYLYSVNLNLIREIPEDELDSFDINAYAGYDDRFNPLEHIGKHIKVEAYADDEYGFFDTFDVYYREKLFFKGVIGLTVFKNKHIMFKKDGEVGIYVYSLDMKFEAKIPLDIRLSPLAKLANGFILLDNAILTDKWEVKYKFEKITRLESGRLLAEDKGYIMLLSEDMKILAKVEKSPDHIIYELKNRNFIQRIKSGLKRKNFTGYFKHDYLLLSKDMKTIKPLISDRTIIRPLNNYYDLGDTIVFEENYSIKFYSAVTGELFNILPIQYESNDLEFLENKLMAVFSEIKKTFVYNTEEKYKQKHDLSGKLQRSGILENGDIVALFSDNSACIYSSGFELKKIYKEVEAVCVLKDTFAIQYNEGRIEIIDKNLNAIEKIDQYGIVGSVSDNILLRDPEGYLYFYLCKQRIVKSTNISLMNDEAELIPNDFTVDNSTNTVIIRYNRIHDEEKEIKEYLQLVYVYDKEGNMVRCEKQIDPRQPNFFNLGGKGCFILRADNDESTPVNTATIRFYSDKLELIKTINIKEREYCQANYYVFDESIILDKNSNFIRSLRIANRDQEYSCVCSDIVTIYNCSGMSFKVIEDVFLGTQLSSGDILMDSGAKTMVYSVNYEYKKTLDMEYVWLVKELADGSLIFSDRNGNTVYYDADYELVSGKGKFNIDTTKHKKFEYFKDTYDRHIFIYHYVPNIPKVLRFYADCEVEEFEEYFRVLYRNSIGILYKNIDKTEFYYVPNEAKVIKIYEDRCLIHLNGEFAYFDFMNGNAINK